MKTEDEIRKEYDVKFIKLRELIVKHEDALFSLGIEVDLLYDELGKAILDNKQNAP